jgi:DNA-binding transcriptional LysR family regulator
MLLRHANLMADIVSAAHDDVSDTDTPNEGPLHLVTGDGLGPYWMARRIPQFLASYPGIELTLSISDRPPDPLNNAADIAIQFEPPNRSEWISRRMGVVHYLCFASRGYLDLHGIPTSLTDFHHHRRLLHEGYVNQSGHWAKEAFLARQLIPFSLMTNSTAPLIACCQAGGGIAVLPSYIGAAYPDLVPLALPEMASIQFWMTYTKRVRRITHGQVVVEWLRKAFDPTESDWFRANLTRPEFTPAASRSAEIALLYKYKALICH